MHQNQCQQLQLMQTQINIREQMHRYPVFSCQPELYIDESQMFKDEDIKNTTKRNLTIFSKNDHKNQAIVSIYDRILVNNSNDPLYVHARRQKQKHYSTVTTARNSRCDLERGVKKNKTNAISRFMGEIASSLNKDETTHDGHRTQKISLLKRIIEHYNIKSVERKYYSNLIKNFGLKIESVNSNQIAVKKNIHPRQNTTKNISIKDVTQPPLQQIQTEEALQVPKNISNSIKRPSLSRNSRPSRVLTKQYSFQLSRQNLKSQKSNILMEEGKKLRGQISQKMRRSIEYSQKIMQKPIKIQASSSIQDKINKYRDFLFIINLSNHMYRDLDVEKYEKTFKFYVGKGNNANLIKSLMKKRFWFEETNDVNQANFVWTQIKVQEIFKDQKVGIRKQDLEHELTNSTANEQGDNIFSEQKFEELKNEIKYQQKTFNKHIKFGKCKSKARDYAPQDPILKIITSEDSKCYRQICDALIFKKYPSFMDKFKLSSKKMQYQSDNYVVHNHFPLNGLLGNKKALFYNIKQFCKLSNKKLSQYIPPTFHIKKGLMDEQYKSISSTFMQRKKKNLPNYWIMKPGQYSNRGQGITCTNKLQDIRQRISKCREMSRSGKEATLIVQQYISNPLLYNGRKFDIRVFMMITITNGKIKGYWYQEGYVRTSSFVWNLHEMYDKYIHLTNDAVQKTCEEYGKYEPGNKLTFTQLQRYLYTLPKCGRNMEFFDAIYPQMRAIAADAIKCACLNLDPKRLRDNFQIFGLDFMIDQNIKPYLIEVNTNPCLQLNCPILQRILPHMIQNAFRISLDPLFPPPSTINSEYKYSIPQNALFYNKFELVFDEDRDGDGLQKMYKNSQILQVLDDLEEEQELYEDEGNLLDIHED